MRFTKRTLTTAVLSVLLISTSHTILAKTIDTRGDQAPPAKINNIQSTTAPRIQLAILLDTSSSMDGLIDQTRNQLWQVVNEFSSATQNGVKPILEVALFEYGNDNNSESKGYIKRLNQFTRELDRVSEGLFSLTTNGGEEFCGFAIKEAVNSLQWSKFDSDIKTIFIAGNEPFTQGPVNYQSALELAKKQGISVNTIHAGNHQEGIDSGWQSGAVLAGGSYMSIDANQQVVHIESPQDVHIALLNKKLNETYIPYGEKGVENKSRQVEQDKESSKISAGLMSKRAQSKSSSFYNNSKWDLVDALKEGEVAAEELEAMPVAALPEPMKSMTASERTEYVATKAEARKNINEEIVALSKLRDTFVADEKRKQINAKPSMGDALTEAVRKQAEQKDFIFEKE